MQKESPSKREVPDQHDVYRRVPPLCWCFPKNRVSSGAFSDPEMSVDWQEYCTLEQAQALGGENHGAVALNVKFLRDLTLKVNHDPCPPEQVENKAHTLVLGKKTDSICKKCRDHAMNKPLRAPKETPKSA